MDCNRDEALRAKQIAERKFAAKDAAAARKFALKAHNLYPELDGITQMLATLDVYLAAENKIAGETDWYAVLNVSATADDETVKKQYRKLALILHPDKNKSIGADGAFKFLSEAWSVLSDKTRRMAYDHKRNAKGSQQKSSQPQQKTQQAQQKTSQPSRGQAAPSANGSHKSTNSTASSNTRPPKTANCPTTPAAAPAAAPRQSKPNTFWTSCNLCKMQYEYLRVYLNHNLLCPNCQKPFLAIETGTPSNGSNAPVPWSFPQHRQQNVNHNVANKTTYIHGRNSTVVPNMGTAAYQHGVGHSPYNHVTYQWGTFAAAPSHGATTNVVHHTVRREESVRRRNYTSRRSSSVGSYATNYNAASTSSVATSMERPAKKRRDDDGGNQSGGTNVNAGTYEAGANGITSPMLDMRNLLIEKARIEIRKKLNEWNGAKTAKTAVKGMETSEANAGSNDQDKNGESANGDNQGPSDQEITKSVVITVPDPDFHDFDKDRMEASFDANQVWAAYDDDDGMPRFYALIQKVMSLKPFKMRFSWLNSKSNSELGPMNWVGSGFTKTCGEFRVGRYEVYNTVNVFSHMVKWDKGVRGAVKIVPRQGDTWALYRNWSPDWSETTTDEVIHKYEMVEVLEDYTDENGVSVTPLVKVAGFKTVFHRHLDPAQVRRVPREEMFRFSHQVPSWLLTGEEAQNAPKGCRELDPAATPLELLQVITETRDEMESAEQKPAS